MREMSIQDQIPYDRMEYSKTLPSVNVSFSFSRNERPQQEDRVCVYALPAFYSLDGLQKKQVLNNAFAKVENNIVRDFSDVAENTGSTAIITIGYLTRTGNQTTAHIYHASLGDSCGYIVVRNKLTLGIRYWKRLNIIHNPKDPEEVQRILNYGRGIFVTGDGRINNRLNLSRAFGDLEYGPLLSKVADINYTGINLKNDEELLILNVSDGLSPVREATSRELRGKDASSIQEKCTQFHGIELTNHLMRSFRNTDNSTVVLQELSLSPQLESDSLRNPKNTFVTIPVLIGVCDGHNGSEISDYVAKILPKTINNLSLSFFPDPAQQQLQRDKYDQQHCMILYDFMQNVTAFTHMIYDHKSKLTRFEGLSFFIQDRFPLMRNPDNHRINDFEEMLKLIIQVLDEHGRVDYHKYPNLDKYLFFKDSTDSWQTLITSLQNHAYQWLEKIAASHRNLQAAEQFIARYLNHRVFTEQSANSWFQKGNKSEFVLKIEELIEQYKAKREKMLHLFAPPPARING